MSEQEKPAGWKIFITTERSQSGGAILRQKIYYVAIPDEGAMLNFACDHFKLNVGMLAGWDPISAEVLEQHHVKEGGVFELAEIVPRGSLP